MKLHTKSNLPAKEITKIDVGKKQRKPKQTQEDRTDPTQKGPRLDSNPGPPFQEVISSFNLKGFMIDRYDIYFQF